MSFLFPDPPTPPDPTRTAAAQTGTNVSTAVANSYLNNVNQVTPQGSLTYSDSGSYEWKDPSTGHTYTIPTRTSTQTYSIDTQKYLQENPDVAAAGVDPAWHWQNYGQYEGRGATGEAGIYKASQDTRQNLANMGAKQSARVGELLSTPFDPLTGAPQGGDASAITGVRKAATSTFNPSQYLQINPDVAAAAKASGMNPEEFARLHYETHGMAEGRAANNSGQVQGEFGDAGAITKSYGPADDFSSDRQRVEDSLMARMNPQLAKERSNIEQRLADQGIRYGSQAYASAMDDYNRQATDTRFGAIGQAGQEQQRMMDMAAQRAGFENSAQQQQYEQNLGRGTFANAAQGQRFTQNNADASFYNAGLAQQVAQGQSGFNAQNAQRNQYLQEQYQQRQQPINEIAALSTGSQVQNPNWLNSPSSQIPTTDFAGIMQNNFQNQMGIYNQQSQNMQNLVGGAAGAGAAYLRSDRRVKKNIDKIGTVFAHNEDAEREGLPIYEWEYKNGDGERHTGPMAQDVEKLDKKAVKTIGGVKHINPRRVMGNILRAA